jgi:hypothetical protein
MNQMQSHMEIAIESIKVFMNDGKLDATEFDRLIELALRDQVIDADERRVLLRILVQAEQAGIDTITRARIAQVREAQKL